MARKTGGEERAAALQRLKAALKTGDVGNFYVFFGEEAFLKEHYWRMLEKKLLDGPAAKFNFHRFNAETLSPQALSEAYGIDGEDVDGLIEAVKNGKVKDNAY